MSEQLDRKELKVQALLEKVSSLTTNYENQVADLRVELTVANQTQQELNTELNSLRQQLDSNEDSSYVENDLDTSKEN